MKQTEDTMKNRWLSVEDGVKRDTIYRWIKTTYKVVRLWKFKSNELDTWVKSGNAIELDDNSNGDFI